jgi:hypothetical protein
MSKVEFDSELKRLAACVLVAQNAKRRGNVEMMVDAIADCNAISKELAKHLGMPESQ